jgi:hypothetical protein
MVVRENQRGGVVLQGLPDDLPRMHAGAVDGAAEDFFEVDQTMAVVEVQAAEHFVWAVAQLRGEELARRRRRIERRPGAQRLPVMASSQFQRRHQRRVARRAEPALFE